jgi:hypothetical protein
MTRHAWLPIVLAALFGLRGPLCLYACLESAEAAPLAATEAPCHGGEEPVGPPEPAEHACSCDETEAIVASVGAKEAPCPVDAPIAPSAVVAGADARRAAVAIRLPDRSPPPADLLLLNATLLL